uniref:Uncharacterized protein n=1 Tax=Setaria italica TaxID=4555 RepID=K3YBP2_SETIT
MCLYSPHFLYHFTGCFQVLQHSRLTHRYDAPISGAITPYLSFLVVTVSP